MASTKHDLNAEQELRIEATKEDKVTVTLLRGDAEILGIELAQNKAYDISHRKLPIFSWHGCRISVQGATDIAYIASNTPMPAYVNTFAVIHNRRLRASAAAQTVVPPAEGELSLPPEVKGPRVIILGPPESGKSTVASLLLNYSVKTMGRSLFVDLDITRNSMSIPGTLSASMVSNVDIEEGPHYESPIAFFYGYLDADQNNKELERLIATLGSVIDRKLDNVDDSQGCGYICRVGGWIEKCSREFVGALIRNMKADTVFVIGAERMYADVKHVMENEKGVEVIDLPRSGGVVRSDEATKHKEKFRQYFYGKTFPLNPFSIVVDFSAVTIYRVGGGTAVPLSALPIGAEPTLDPHRVVSMTIQPDLIHSILAVSQATEEKDVAEAAVSGFVHVTKVEMQTRKLTLLAPFPGELPSRCLLAGNLKWLE